jgi:hypothetical protein
MHSLRNKSQRKLKKCFELSENKNKISQNTNEREISIYSEKEEKFQINTLYFLFNKLEKENQIKYKIRKKTRIIKIEPKTMKQKNQ